MSEYPYRFEAELESFDFGRVNYTVVFAPMAVVEQLEFPASKRLRIDGELNGFRIEAALMPSKGRWYLLVSKRLRKECALSLGDVVSVEFEVADQDAVNVPQELTFALEADERASAVWRGWTAGKQRGWCYRIASAKRAETRERRVEEVLDQLRDEIT
ncbi:MAG: YdeI/OmpD-associated family protein [Planctomycetota bacterium]